MQASRREIWAYRVGLALFLVFMACGVYLWLNLSDAMERVFIVLLMVTLGVGLLGGLIAVYVKD